MPIPVLNTGRKSSIIVKFIQSIKCIPLYIFSKNLILSMRKKKNKEGERDDGIKAFLLGLGLGTIGYAILSLFAKPRCPNCCVEVEKNTPQCPRCKMYLQWH